MKHPAYETRGMQRKDVPYVLHIEYDCFLHPWKSDDFRRYLKQKYVTCSVIIVKTVIVGFVVIQLERPITRIVNLAIAPAWQRKGIGQDCVEYLKKNIHHRNCNRLSAQVSEENLSAQQFFKACGFRAAAVDRGYYGNGEDAYRMEYLPGGPLTEPRNRIKNYLPKQ